MANSLCGDDAFYREAFADAGPPVPRDRYVACACAPSRYAEQIQLKMRKGSVFATFASFQLKQRISTTRFMPPVQNWNVNSPPSPSERMTGRECDDSEWFGTTVPEWTSQLPLQAGNGVYWMKGIGSGLTVRCGPDYVRNGRKIPSSSTMYEAISLDAIKADTKITDVVGRIMKIPPPPQVVGGPEHGAGAPIKWTHACGLPRMLVINLMLPFESGLNPFNKAEHGCSIIGVFHIKPEILRAIQLRNQPPAVKLFQKFCDGPAGLPGGRKDDPNRCLGARKTTQKADRQSGLFKAVAYCENPEDINVPELFHRYNGKPALITNSGYVIKDPEGEWMEIGVDVRKFNALCRKMLCSFRDRIPLTKIHYGFMIQGVEDEELPEALLCDLHCVGIDIMEDPVKIPNTT
eukprot:TRINITY_DN10444_c0_g1_i3.p1 TRINITY_DN10444_c0_g1~~TRINITY_DN10444_c0_g1_i3.p1  ORF type:complete len:454 (-),score=70.14 TRINITY_DN10444_c0_g1_i3:318-1532(-)